MKVETRSYQMKEVQGDMMTPISIFHSLHGKKKMLFESSAKHEESGRYSFIAVDPIGELTGDQHGYSLSFENEEIEREQISVIEKLKTMFPVHQDPYPFSFFVKILVIPSKFLIINNFKMRIVINYPFLFHQH